MSGSVEKKYLTASERRFAKFFEGKHYKIGVSSDDDIIGKMPIGTISALLLFAFTGFFLVFWASGGLGVGIGMSTFLTLILTGLVSFLYYENHEKNESFLKIWFDTTKLQDKLLSSHLKKFGNTPLVIPILKKCHYKKVGNVDLTRIFKIWEAADQCESQIANEVKSGLVKLAEQDWNGDPSKINLQLAKFLNVVERLAAEEKRMKELYASESNESDFNSVFEEISHIIENVEQETEDKSLVSTAIIEALRRSSRNELELEFPYPIVKSS